MHGHVGGSRKIEPGRHLSELFERVVYGCFVWVGDESVDKLYFLFYGVYFCLALKREF